MADEGRGLDEERAGEERGVGVYSCVVLEFREGEMSRGGLRRVRGYAGMYVMAGSWKRGLEVMILRMS